ncbi:hypothetical protein [Streptomyces ipomoeae]|uniref:hypothetical protein n=1 Tax=Streptomyces ipomoeae TaxID=103232 RepID=UPI0029A9CE63|nr:hypothetical protein [Streptomyces ipomoeae]MDX2697247.1 hypothetical protein [Streptomyces ipomoeae]
MAAARKTTSARARQYPAKAGEPEVEVDERSADGSDGMRFVKEFVVLARQWGDSEEEHTANKAGVVNEAIQRGLHPRGDVSFDGSHGHPDGLSLTLTYSVETVPASVDHQPEDTTTPRDVTEGD